jgi:hypothetical protein
VKPADRRRPPDLEPDEEELFTRVDPTAVLPDAGRQCPGPERLQAAQAGALPEEVATGVEGHLASCPGCRALAAELAQWEGPELSPHEQERIRRRIGGTAAGQPSRRRGPSRTWALTAAAAALVAAVPAWIAIQRDGGTPSPPPRGAETPAPPALRLEKLPVLTPPGGSLTWRDGGGALEAELPRALAPYAAGDLDEAARRLAPLAARHPEAPAPGLYLGVVHLLRGEAAGAVAVLERVPREEGAFWTPHVEWYLAVARERAGQPAGADGLLRGLCGGKSEYTGPACAAARLRPVVP